MKHFKNPFQITTIKIKLIFIFAIIISYSLIVISVFGYGSYRNLMIKKSLSYSKKNAEELSMLLQEKILNLNNFTRTILYDDRIYSFNREKILNGQEPYFYYKFGTDVENYLRSVLYSKDELISVGFKFKGDKRIFVESSIYTLNNNVINDFGKIYAAGKAGKGSPVWVVSNTSGMTNIYVSKIVYDINTLQEIGVLIFRVNPDSIFDMLRNLSPNTQQNMYVLDGTGKVLYDYTYFKLDKDIIGSILKLGNTKDFVKIKAKNDTVYANTNVIEPESFKLIICMSSKSLLKEVNNLSKFLILLFLMTIPILLILINYFFVDIIKPLNLLVSKMKKIEGGEIGATIELNRRDEIGYVIKTFNKMSQQIKVLIDSVYKEQIALKDSEIKALTAQINPHFLYNTLETINWKARIHGVNEISDMVMALSYIMEANMNRGNEKLISIEKEIEYIDNYRLIIEKRFNEKLKFRIDASEETKQIKIPKLIILPLIENSVYHGLETKKGSGMIELSVEVVSKDLVIKVRDDGLGIEEENLKKIKHYLDVDVNDIDDINVKSAANIGLINVNKRIKLLYGNEYGVEISSVLNEGTEVVIKLPCIY